MRREEDAREHPRPGVEAALATLARGLLAHPDNAPLRAALDTGALSSRNFYAQLLRRVFRLIVQRIIEARTLEPLEGLFADRCPALDTAHLDDSTLSLASSQLDCIGFHNLRPERLGTIYETLLERVPIVSSTSFTFATGDASKGNARKTSGSYYTPDSLVQLLLDSALEPLLAERIVANPDASADALLDLTLVDPACGTGHFLLAAARRLATHVARLRSGDPSEYQRALRDVVTRCIHGVDRDPLAVDLCKLALWLEVADPRLPLTFLDAKIRRGDALFGAPPELLSIGIPDIAWEPLPGDDRRTASALKQRNARERSPCTTPARADPRLIADAWCAAFVWPKPAPGDPALEAAPTAAVWQRLRDGDPPARTVAIVTELAARHDFFHWHLEFPEVFARGGFDLALGNPPWEKIKILDKEWFAQLPELAAASSAAVRKRLLAAVREQRPDLHREYTDHARRVAGYSHFLRNSGGYPLCGRGDINLYAVFAELIRGRLGARGRGACIVPTGIATDDTTKRFFQKLLNDRATVSLYDFENGKRLFPSVQGNVKFCLLTMSARPTAAFRVAAQLDDPEQLRDPARTYAMTAEDVWTVNPNTGNCPTFRLARDAGLVTAIHRRFSVLHNDRHGADNPWKISFGRMFDMTNDSHHFKNSEELDPSERVLPLYEAKLAHQFNHRAATFAGIPAADRFRTHARTAAPTDAQLRDPSWTPVPRYWVPFQEVERRWPDASAVIGFRNAISATADSRSLVATLFPRAGLGNSLPFIHTARGPVATALLVALLNSFVVDHVLRQKASGGNLNYYILKQLPIPAPDAFETPAPWQRDTPFENFIVARVLELSYHSWDLAPFARELGHDGPPFRWDPARRSLLRAELDAAVFHLYGLSRDDVDHVLDAFPIVRRSDEQAHGEYRTRRIILDIFDAMTDAARTGVPYRPRVEPQGICASKRTVATTGKWSDG